MFDFIFPDLTERSSDPEKMDLPDCDRKKLINTVKQFALLNYLFTNSRGLIKKYILSKMISDPLREYSFLDIGAGGCDVAVWLLKFCRRKKLKIRITCLDNEPAIINYARSKCRNYPEITLLNDSAFNLDKLEGYDFIFANHFLHHLKKDEINKIIKVVKKKAQILFLINDIKRSNPAFLGYSLFTGIFCHNSFAFYDGRLSIKKGFTRNELEEIINDKSIRIESSIPARLVLIG